MDSNSNSAAASSPADTEELVTFTQWEAVGVRIQRVDHKAAEYPFVANEDDSTGRHWVYGRALRRVGEGARVVLQLRLRPINLSALRLRVDIGGAVINATL